VRKPRNRNVGAGKGVKSRLDPDTLEALLRASRSQRSIAEEYGCTPQFVSLLVHEYGLHERGDRDRGRGG
jgi:hypothetical protein